MPTIPIKQLSDYAKNPVNPETSIDAVEGLRQKINEINGKFPQGTGNGKFITVNSEGKIIETQYDENSFAPSEDGTEADNSISYAESQELSNSQRIVALSNVKNRLETLGDKQFDYLVVDNDQLYYDCFSYPQTIFEITYNISELLLSPNDTIYMGENTVLFFNGGKISNLEIVGDNTRIIANTNAIFDNVTLSGTWIIQESCNEWFVNCDVDECNDILKNNNSGFRKFDEDLNKWIMWNGTEWMNLDGSPITVCNVDINIASGLDYDNKTTQIEYGKPYLVHLESQTGYVVLGATITMGDDDITSFVYEKTSGTIYIPSVIDDITIDIVSDRIYLRFTACEENSTISIQKSSYRMGNINLDYSINYGSWVKYNHTTITLNNINDNVRFKGSNAGTYSNNYYWYFVIDDGAMKADGDVTALMNNIGGDANFTLDATLRNLFYNCRGLITPPNLPITTLANYCYSNMFNGCTSLTTAPALPATTLANNCYQNMFQGCTSLTTAPALPATTLANYCYQNMFQGCTSLTTAPELPATTLANSCYSNMFNGCTGLETAPELSATTLANSCYGYMFNGCTSLTTAPDLPATTLANSCYNVMFSGCTSLETAPALPATTLADNCYQYMFNNCTSLTTAPVLSATTLTQNCYNSMFNGCTSLNYIKALFTTTPSNSYTYNWVRNVSANGTFVKSSNATWEVVGDNGVPTGWDIMTYPES